MSCFCWMFVKKGPSPTPQEALRKLRQTEGMLMKKQEEFEGKIKHERLTAAKHGTKNKKQALDALKRMKKYEKQLSQIDGTLSNVEFQLEALETVRTNTEVLNNTAFAAKALKSAHENVNIDNIGDLQEDVRKHQELAQEITGVLSNFRGDEFDEDELLDELNEIMGQDEKKLPEVRGVLNVPPTSLPARAAKRKQGNGMEELQRCMEAM